MSTGGKALASPSRRGPEHTALPATPDSLRPTSFFLASEETVEKSTTSEPGIDSTFGVRSLQETTGALADGDLRKNHVVENEANEADGESGRRRSTLKPRPVLGDCNVQNVEARSVSNTSNSSPRRLLRRSSPPSTSQSLASLSQASQELGSSLSSSPKSISNRSFRPSDADSGDGASQALASSEDEAEVPPELGDSAPQLIMPSIRIPSRRPFTDRGKQVGRLKILIAGDSGIGKSSLIKSIVQTCEDIVHVDPLSPSSSHAERSPAPKIRVKRDTAATGTTQHITEVFASTKPYPSWWSEIEEHRVFRKHKSMGDAVLERNVCFVDTPGFSRETSATELVLQYIEDQLSKTFSSTSMTERDVVSMLSGYGGTQVDLVLYMISQDIKSADLEFLRRLSAFTNVVPLIAKADLLSEEEVEASKAAMKGELETAGIRPFTLGTGSDSEPPYTVCSAVSKDEETMDASLLMSPDYVQPLISSDLSLMVQQIFNTENIPRLRHLAAAKLIRHHSSTSPSASPFNRVPNPAFSPATTASFLTRSQTLTQGTNFPSSYLQAQITDHTLREEWLAQARLARWATDLQRGLHNERARYEALARGERAAWLTQRLSECVNESPAETPEMGIVKWSSPTAKVVSRSHELDASDPLGLVNWSDVMRRRGWTILEVVGGFGVLGAVAVWVARGSSSQWDLSDGGWWSGWWAGNG